MADFVSTEVCKALHQTLVAEVERNRRESKEQLAGLTDAISKLGDRLEVVVSEIHASAVQEASNKAWAQVGKYGLTLVACVSTVLGIAWRFGG